ncbi:formyltetrahydrofolate deformylase [Tamaricihabitans halophyticus]|uniref:Formyltetrahydrofolate deformylase n=1 Tax=Tamaricihabitans halophyticus TaxID=1262583 RepID=A0A4R2QQ74_9PSEU|nr:formyltetrahydrofolate deformylase [Tamaricihabitans halophyticus]TCP51870.1 formyltetrahydrofolate deformylase [Tamaricihabitans halophyticus]
MSEQRLVLALSCPERAGLVHEVSRFLVDHGCDILDNRQFGDRGTGRFSMRVEFLAHPELPTDELAERFGAVADRCGMDWTLRPGSDRPRLLVMASKASHCLNDLLYRWQTDTLSADIALVVSNHPDAGQLARFHGVPFEHLPVRQDSKPAAEARLLELVDEHDISLVVLARYMQILSDELCERLRGRAINIHHSFLPSFKGAKPYHQAYDRGVKFVGATAHYVTPQLDEGPIIEQELIRIDHTYSPEQLAKVGRDAECLALSRAVRWHCEQRVFLDDDRTVVFS